jgi:hypothetical protein
VRDNIRQALPLARVEPQRPGVSERGAGCAAASVDDEAAPDDGGGVAML